MTVISTDPISLAQALIRCRSVTPHEGGALRLIESVLQPAGFVCHPMTFAEPGTADVENLYARLGTHGPNLCFAGHTDVVPAGKETSWSAPPFAAEIHDGRLIGRGAVDMKGAIACFIAAAIRQVTRVGGAGGQGFPGSISLLITGDEEGPSINGTAKMLGWLKDRDERLSACIVGEPSNPTALGDEIKIGRRGSMNGELVVKGVQGHAAYPERAENPVPKLAAIVERISRARLDMGSTAFQPSNLEVTVIEVASTATNVIPAEARAKFNVRYNDHWRRATIEAHVAQMVAEAAASVGARYEVRFSGTGDVFLTQPGPLVDTLTAAIEAETGKVPALTTGGGTSDARFIKDFCPVVEFGLVNATIHQVDEQVPLADLEALTRIYERFIAGYFAASA